MYVSSEFFWPQSAERTVAHQDGGNDENIVHDDEESGSDQ